MTQKRWQVKTIGIGTLFETFNIDVGSQATPLQVARAATRCVDRYKTAFQVLDDFMRITVTFDIDGAILVIIPAERTA